MKKEDAKTILATIHDEILSHIEAKEGTVDPSVLIDFLHDLANGLVQADFRAPFNFYAPYLTFEDEYRRIARQSIDSYTDTNKKIAEISQQQQDALDHVTESHELTRRFNDIQNTLTDEVERASLTIRKLSERIVELETTAALDPMTKVLNRRSMDLYLEEMVAVQNDHMPLYLLMIDVDDFKEINDNYGHIAGDKVLMVLANIMKSTLRDSDRIFRYGGEEFVIVLNRVDDEGCLAVTQRILSLARNNKLIYKQHHFSVTLSIGVASLKRGDTVEAIINRADKALYRAKNRGKDQMEVEF